MKRFSVRLKDMRHEKSLSQRQLAKMVGVSQPTIVTWENEQRQPTADAIIKLALFFNVSAGYLLGLEDEP